MSEDLGYSALRCISGLRAAEALAAGGPAIRDRERRHWEAVILHWKQQLAYAQARDDERRLDNDIRNNRSLDRIR